MLGEGTVDQLVLGLRRRRLHFIANNDRFLILPGESFPNLASTDPGTESAQTLCGLAVHLWSLHRAGRDLRGIPTFLPAPVTVT